MPPSSQGVTEPASIVVWFFCARHRAARGRADGLVGVLEPVHREEVDARRSWPAESAPRTHRICEADGHALAGQVPVGGLETAPSRAVAYPVSKRLTMCASSEKARASSSARAMNANTSISDSTVEPYPVSTCTQSCCASNGGALPARPGNGRSRVRRRTWTRRDPAFRQADPATPPSAPPALRHERTAATRALNSRDVWSAALRLGSQVSMYPLR